MSGHRQLVLGFGHQAALGDEHFMVAPCNREAVAWVDRWPQWPAPAVVVHGPGGCGKTHLVQRFLGRTGARALSLVDLDADHAGRWAAAASALVLDDVDRQLRPEREEALLHLYNAVRETRRHLLLTAMAPPARWPVTLADLRSRLNAAPAVAIGPPDETLLRALLVKLFADRQLNVGSSVIEFLLVRMERTFASARALVARIDEEALNRHHRVDVPFVRQVLREADGGQGGPP